MRRWSWVALIGLACGPTNGIPDPGEDPTSSGAGAQGGDDGAADDDGAAGPMTTGLPNPGSADGSTGTTDGSESSTGAPPFMDSDVVGAWLCTGDYEPFVMHVDDYMSPSDLLGAICASWNGAVDPLQWGPCSNLSAHPIGGGPYLPIYAEVYDPIGGTFWIVSAGLVYDPASDTMDGTWFDRAPDGEPIVVSCLRLQ